MASLLGVHYGRDQWLRYVWLHRLKWSKWICYCRVNNYDKLIEWWLLLDVESQDGLN